MKLKRQKTIYYIESTRKQSVVARSTRKLGVRRMRGKSIISSGQWSGTFTCRHSGEENNLLSCSHSSFDEQSSHLRWWRNPSPWILILSISHIYILSKRFEINLWHHHHQVSSFLTYVLFQILETDFNHVMYLNCALFSFH